MVALLDGDVGVAVVAAGGVAGGVDVADALSGGDDAVVGGKDGGAVGASSSALGWSLVTPVMGWTRIPNAEVATRVPWGSGTRPAGRRNRGRHQVLTHESLGTG
ncbi:hypothetical protein HMPREF9947_0800 [Propionibacterium sp. 409-HC1]|nr:hypothetical protein HMPREF9947_0800 [Propionibacterium sp. 409-HC1]